MNFSFAKISKIATLLLVVLSAMTINAQTIDLGTNNVSSWRASPLIPNSIGSTTADINAWFATGCGVPAGTVFSPAVAGTIAIGQAVHTNQVGILPTATKIWFATGNTATGDVYLIKNFILNSTQNATLNLSIAADDIASICLNGQQIGTVQGITTPTKISLSGAVLQSKLRCGENTLVVKVHDYISYNWMACEGTLTTSGTTSTATAAVTSVTCNGTLGLVSLSASGNGLSPFSYAWSNGAATQSLSNVPLGSYSVTVTDGSGCKGVKTLIPCNPCAANSTGNTSTSSLEIKPNNTLVEQTGNVPTTMEHSNTIATTLQPALIGGAVGVATAVITNKINKVKEAKKETKISLLTRVAMFIKTQKINKIVN